MTDASTPFAPYRCPACGQDSCACSKWCEECGCTTNHRTSDHLEMMKDQPQEG